MRNRVTPLGDIVATDLRGAWTGNRGILHEGTDVVRFHRGSLWITCELQFKGRRLPQWSPGHFTVLFFHDEAVALAAGHRPCALCRRPAYDGFRLAWAAGNGGRAPSAREVDARLHAERIVRGTHRRKLHARRWLDIPPGAFVMLDGSPALVTEHAVIPWTLRGYGTPHRRPRTGTVQVVTPPSTLGVLRAGYVPQLDAVARVGSGRLTAGGT